MQAKGMTEVYVGTRILIAAKALHGLSQRIVRTHSPPLAFLKTSPLRCYESLS
jgi:hypothetical protein